VSWVVVVFFQERGSKNELSAAVSFPSRSQAVAALEKLESDVAQAEETALIVIDSGSDRISFVKRDFRRTSLYEGADDPIILGRPIGIESDY
jgi:hypothetical protein